LSFPLGFDVGFKFWFRFSKENKLVSTVVGFAIGFVGNKWLDLRTLKFGAIRVAASADQCVLSVVIYDQLSEGLAANPPS
jgi:uncharacterized membrane protein YbhN (UPF0104 family)